jgi:glycosyltransferase involved in cell wall biosynthesis
MRICRIGTYPYEATPGAGLFPYFITKYILEPCLYITYWLPGARLEPPEHVQIMAVKTNHVATGGAIRTLFLSGGMKVPWRKKLVSAGRVASKVCEIPFFLKSALALLRFKPDVICAHLLKNSILGLLGKYILGAKFIYYSHNVSEPMLLHRIASLRWIVNQADLIYAVSPRIADEMAKMVPAEKIRATSTGVDLRAFYKQNTHRHKRLLAIGRLKWKKGYNYLLDAMPDILAQHPDYVLTIVGDGEERASIETQIQTLGLQNNVELLGEISQDEIVTLLNESKLFVMASLIEGLPKAMLEALACGTPVVVTDGCNATEIVKGAGIEVPSADSRALARAVNQLLGDTELWQQYAHNARSRVLDYTWETIAADNYREYQRLLA